MNGRWEYEVRIINTANGSLHGALNARGGRGWELVSLTRDPLSSHLYEAVFKRFYPVV